MDAQILSREVDSNFDYFQRHLADYLSEHLGEYALLRKKAVVAFFRSPGEADREGRRRYRDGIYSIQQVADDPVDLGLYSNGAN
jgi:hypothetical protein